MQLHVEERAKGHIQVKSHVPQKAEANKKRLGPFDEGIPTIISAIGWQQSKALNRIFFGHSIISVMKKKMW